MYSLIKNSNIPKFLKVLLIILLTLTCVYWIGVLIFKFLSILRIFLHWVTESRNWWTFLMCVFILLVGSFLVAQFSLGLDPFGKFIQAIVRTWNNLRNFIAGKIAI